MARSDLDNPPQGAYKLVGMDRETTSHRELLLEAAQRLILAKGFPATRVDEICEAAGVTKGSFYHHFASKDEIAHALIDHYFSRVTAGLCDGPWTEDLDAVSRLMGFLDHALRVLRGPLLKQGCLLGSFALDLSETHPTIRAEVETRFDALVGVVEPLIRAALKARGIRPTVSATMLARQFVSVLQGSLVLAKAYGDHGKLAEGMKCYRGMLEALLRP